MVRVVLELKKTNNEGGIFYRYNISGTLLWFEQYQNSGHIYTVAARPSVELEGIKFYVQDGSKHEVYYPEWVEIDVEHTELNVDQVDEYISKLKFAKEVANVIEDIFNSPEHIDLYKEFHKQGDKMII